MSEDKKEQQAKVEKSIAPSKAQYFLLPLSLIAALLATGIAVYSLQNNQQIQDSLLEDNKKLSQQIQQLKSEQSQSQAQIDAREENLKQLQANIHSKITHMNQEVQSSLNQLYYKNEDWLLLKARYYIELAQINAHWSNDYNSAIALLEQADSILNQMSDTKIFDIRQALASEIAQLKAIPTLDTVGILSQLDAAQTSINSLSNPSARAEINKENPSINSEPQTGWRAHLQSSLNLLGKMVVVRRNEEQIKPLMSLEYEALIKENIRLNLQEAQWAVLNKNPKVYNLVLEQAITNIKHAFGNNNSNTEALINQIKKLQQVSFSQEQPQIGQALPLINQVLQASSKKPATNLKTPANTEDGAGSSKDKKGGKQS